MSDNFIIEKYHTLVEKDDKIKVKNLKEFDKWFKKTFGNNFDDFLNIENDEDDIDDETFGLLKLLYEFYYYFSKHTYDYFDENENSYYKYIFTVFSENAALQYMLAIESEELQYKSDKHQKVVIALTTYLIHLRSDISLRLCLDRVYHGVLIKGEVSNRIRILAISSFISKLINEGGTLLVSYPLNKKKAFVFLSKHRQIECLYPWDAKQHIYNLGSNEKFKYRFLDIEKLVKGVKLNGEN